MSGQSLDVTFTNLSQLSRAYGAPAVDMATRVMQRDAIGQVGTGAGLIIISGAFIFTAVWTACLDREGENIGAVFGCIFSVIFATIAACFGVALCADIWAWTALMDPQLALAHRIFGSMGG